MGEREHEKETKAQERAEKKALQELERQRKKDEQDHKKAEAELERMKKKDEADHAKAIKDFEAKAKKNQIDREERDGLLKELESETQRYNQEFALVRDAMKDAVAKNRACKIVHRPPKIEWGSPSRVVPGSISWTAGGYA